MGRINWGILGCANIAYERVLPGLLQANNACLYAIASRNGTKLEKFLTKYKPEKTYDTYEQLLNDEKVDALYIPLPNSLHLEWVKKAADVGKHILCEKPLALSRTDADDMYRYCEMKNVILMEAFAYRHSPLIPKIKEIVDSGEIGKLKFVESHLTALLDDEKNIRFNESLGGGSFLDMACYNINLISYIVDSNPIKIASIQEKSDVANVDLCNSTIIQYENGVQAFSYSSLNCYPKGGYTIVGERGRIEVPCNFNCRNVQKFRVASGGILSNVEVLEEVTKEYTVFCPDNYMLEIEQMGRCVLDGEKPLVSKEETLHNIEIMDKILEEVNRE